MISPNAAHQHLRTLHINSTRAAIIPRQDKQLCQISPFVDCWPDCCSSWLLTDFVLQVAGFRQGTSSSPTLRDTLRKAAHCIWVSSTTHTQTVLRILFHGKKDLLYKQPLHKRTWSKPPEAFKQKAHVFQPFEI